MVLTPAERQRRRRARLRAGEELPCCTSCGEARLQLERRERPDRQEDGLCWSCWIQTPDGLASISDRRKRARAADPEKIRAQTLTRVRRARAKAKGTTSTTDGTQP